MIRKMLAMTGVFVLCATTATACGGDDDDANSASPPTGQATTTAAAPPPATTAAPEPTEPAAPATDPPATTAAATTAVATTAAEPVERALVKIASSYTVPGSPVFIADELGYFDEVGIDVEFVRIRSASEAIPLLSSEQAQVASGSLSAGLINAVAGGSQLTLAMDAGTNLPGRPIWHFVVRRALVDSGEVTDFADLAGLKIGMIGPGTGFDRGLDLILDQGGLTLDDVQIVGPLSFGDIVAAFDTGGVDAAFMIEPLVALAGPDGSFVPVWTSDEIVGPFEEGVLMYSPKFSGEDADVADRFSVAYLRGVRDYLTAFEPDNPEPELRATVLEIIAGFTELPPAVLEHVIAPGLNINGAVNLDDPSTLQDFFVEQGTVTEPIDLASIAPSRFSDHAVSVLGEL